MTSIIINVECKKRNLRIHNDLWENLFVKDTLIEDIKFVFVPAGPYKKGLNCEEDFLNYDYWIGKYEITNQQYYQFLNVALLDEVILLIDNNLFYQYEGDEIVPAGLYRVKMFDNAIYQNGDSLKLNLDYANHPVISVTWYGCKAFCDYYGFELPNEKEWEKAARGNYCLWFPWGNHIDSSYANYFNSKDPFEPSSTPVGFYNGQNYEGFQTTNAVSVFGCYDMAGNAWEWTRDRFSPMNKFNYGKGGGYNLHVPAFLQVYYVSTYRIPSLSHNPHLDLVHLSDGFRVVKHY